MTSPVKELSSRRYIYQGDPLLTPPPADLMVILDNHSQADDGFMFDLWYGQSGFTEDDWVNTWTALAQRYRVPTWSGTT